MKENIYALFPHLLLFPILHLSSYHQVNHLNDENKRLKEKLSLIATQVKALPGGAGLAASASEVTAALRTKIPSGQLKRIYVHISCINDQSLCPCHYVDTLACKISTQLHACCTVFHSSATHTFMSPCSSQHTPPLTSSLITQISLP